MPPTPDQIPLMEKLVSLCKRRGFIFQSSEIYGGIGGFWDYGPLGAELKRNLRDAWWRAMTRERDDVLGLDATIIMHPAIWKASGHVDTFADLMRECNLTNKRVRADQVEPQSGVIMRFAGAESAGGWRLDRPFEVLMKKGEHIESFRKRVRSLVASSGGEAAGPAEALTLLGETKGTEVEGTIDFHPESGGRLGDARPFNLMLRTFVGPTATDEDVAYLRPETAQAIFAQYKNVLDSSRVKVPFGICQIGKAFRNEVTPKNFTFRSREFEQMELEFFIKPDEAIEIIHGRVAAWSAGADLSAPQPDWGWEMWHRYWVAQRTQFYADIGLGAEVLDYHWQSAEELAHYARACVDILFKFPFGTEELEGIAARGDFDLSQHQKHSNKPLEFFDEELKLAAAGFSADRKAAMVARRIESEAAKATGALSAAEVHAWFDRLFKGFYLPHVIEPSAGLDRLALGVLAHAFSETTKLDEKGRSETITVLRFHPRLAPIQVGIFPLLKNKPELVARAREVYDLLKRHFNCFYDETASIGRRYARQDEIGTPFGVTIDFETLGGAPRNAADETGEPSPDLRDTVTVRERDTAAQHRVKIADLPAWLTTRLG